ncbi:crotonase/enoyl-CoA hydratase family protein [Nocardia sp. CA2R105]|uniref:crotonase/enoyl-CoA hydratase family protein n=1 Tax=Nocardia coffeae TaxID=2873381 RepID=UPI001CA6188C|nr:crotonase/enoyl-CoA hydratase family protein [Nocardia coffeae]MBY8862884.1 crotonase/enoyl-CoA hydratase family protein [Nocardia coffeae]
MIVERRDRILIVTINRPAARNAINAEVSHGLADAMDLLDSSADLSVGVLTGAGGNFCAGMDLKAFIAGEDVGIEGRGLGFTEAPPRKPVIAAVEGFALAGGSELALATDMIVASRTASFGLPEVKRGLVAGGGGLLRLPQRIPYQIALELALTGEAFSAELAHRFGLVNHLVEPGEALDRALELAAVICRNGPLAVAVTKQIVVGSADWTGAEAFDRQRTLLEPVFSSRDAREGAEAFAQKREPVWTGE